MKTFTDRQLAFAGRRFVDEFTRSGDHAAAMRAALRMLGAHDAGQAETPPPSPTPRTPRTTPQADDVGPTGPRLQLPAATTLFRRLLAEVSRVHGPSEASIVRLTEQSIVRIRDELIWLAHRSGLKQLQIAALLCRHHSSIGMALCRFEARLQSEPGLAARMAETAGKREAA